MCSTVGLLNLSFCAATPSKFGLNEGNMKFSTQNESSIYSPTDALVSCLKKQY